MAHLTKYTMAAVGHMLKHYDRAKDDAGNYVKFGNMEIDPERTNENYNLCFRPEGSFQFLKKRLSEVKVLKRKDVNVMCDWVLTLPQNFEFDYRDFFQYAYDFMADRYGEENVICANVHLDETQPHIHFAFVPVIERDKIERVSAFEKVNRKDLKTFHKNLNDFMVDKFGKDIGIVTGITAEQGGNKTIEELKSETIAQLREENKNLIGQIDLLREELKQYKAPTIAVEREKSPISDTETEQPNRTMPSMPEIGKVDEGRRMPSMPEIGKTMEGRRTVSNGSKNPWERDR